LSLLKITDDKQARSREVNRGWIYLSDNIGFFTSFVLSYLYGSITIHDKKKR